MKKRTKREIREEIINRIELEELEHKRRIEKRKQEKKREVYSFADFYTAESLNENKEGFENYVLENRKEKEEYSFFADMIRDIPERGAIEYKGENYIDLYLQAPSISQRLKMKIERIRLKESVILIKK